MLVLSRKEKEIICIGENIRILVTRIRGGRVVFGIDAPVSTSVVRLGADGQPQNKPRPGGDDGQDTPPQDADS